MTMTRHLAVKAAGERKGVRGRCQLMAVNGGLLGSIKTEDGLQYSMSCIRSMLVPAASGAAGSKEGHSEG